MKKIEKVLEVLRKFKPSLDNLYEMNQIFEGLWETGNPEEGLDEMFLFVERYPEADADYDLFRLVHAFEDINDYESGLILSIDRCPCYINMLLVKRIENSGVKMIKGRKVRDIYLDALNYECTPESVKIEIKDWLQQA